jgi:hypothetical protein
MELCAVEPATRRVHEHAQGCVLKTAEGINDGSRDQSMLPRRYEVSDRTREETTWGTLWSVVADTPLKTPAQNM